MSPFCIFMVQWTYYILYFISQTFAERSSFETYRTNNYTWVQDIMAQYRIYYNHTGHCNHTCIFFFSYHAKWSCQYRIDLYSCTDHNRKDHYRLFFRNYFCFFLRNIYQLVFYLPLFWSKFCDQRISCNICISSYHLHDRLYPDYTIKKTG